MAGKRKITDTKAYQTAAATSKATYKPEFQSAQQDYVKGLQAERSAYGGYQDELKNIPHIHANAIANQLQGQLGQFSNLLGGIGPGVDQSLYGLPTGLPTSEVATGTQLYGTLGANALGDIYSDKAREHMFRTSAAREGALASRYAADNLLQNLNNQLDQLRAERAASTMSSYQSTQQNNAFAKFLEDYLGGGNKPGGNQDNISNPRAAKAVNKQIDTTIKTTNPYGIHPGPHSGHGGGGSTSTSTVPAGQSAAQQQSDMAVIHDVAQQRQREGWNPQQIIDYLVRAGYPAALVYKALA